MKKIVFICVNYNNSKYTSKMLQSLLLQNYVAGKVLMSCIVVNNSTDEADSSTLEHICEQFSWVQIVSGGGNSGYFGGINCGLKSLGDAKYDAVVVCNNDLDFANNFIEAVFRSKYDDKIFAICPDVITVDGLHQNPHIKNKIGWFRRFQFDLYFSNYNVARLMTWILGVIRPTKSSPAMPLKACEVHMGIGACYVLTSEFLRRYKQLNYPHFLYGEEAYFSDQIHSAGGILWFDPELLVHHAESASLSKVPKRIAYEYSRSGYPSYRKML